MDKAQVGRSAIWGASIGDAAGAPVEAFYPNTIGKTFGSKGVSKLMFWNGYRPDSYTESLLFTLLIRE